MAYTGYINKEVAKMYGIPYSQLTAEQKKILHADSVRRAKLIAEREEAVLKNNLKAFEDEARMERVLASIYRDCQKQILADVTETIAKVKKAGGEWSYANQSALTRSRGLFEQISKELTKLGQKEQILFTQGLGNIYTDQFLRQVYELGQSIPVKANFNRLNSSLIRKTLDYPWSGAMFSDRLWNDKEILGRNLRVGLTQSMILGESIPQITERINKNINTSKYNAERVARTETKRVTYCAHNDAYEDMGVEELEYRCANGGDSRTCSYCHSDNGKRFKRGEEPTLPRHPNCRCVYIPVVSDEFGDNELNELTGSVRGAENYEKWQEEQKNKLQKEEILTPEEKDYNRVMDEINSSYKAKEVEIASIQAEYDNVGAEISKLSPVRRGFTTPQEAGFSSKKAFTEYDKKLTTDQRALREKLEEAQKELKDLERDKAYLQAVGSGRVSSLEDYRALKKSLKINSSFDYDLYGDEFLEMALRMDDEALAIHKKLSSITEKNWYNSYDGSDGAHYSPYKKRVNMKMSENSHERALSNGLTGSWQTKYHEEGHQLDHLLGVIGSNPLAEDAGNNKSLFSMGRAFTCNGTKMGAKIGEAIGDDILAFLNKAIQYSNKNEGTSYKELKNLNRITSDSRFAFARYINHLTNSGSDRKVACQLGMLSDAIGLYTGDKISPHSYGLWGHRSSYNKDRGKDGANSETWATFCALRTCGSVEEVSFAKSVMPNTWGVLNTVYGDIAKWLLTNDLSY